MKKYLLVMIVLIVSSFVFSACGPSEEAIATMTAAAWTPTPEPTPTPTPVPYDLEVTLQDEAGGALTMMAYVAVEELGEDPTLVDGSGITAFSNLPKEEVTLRLTAQGFVNAKENVILERGQNSHTFTMVADPEQVDPSTACLPGQELLYIEDFEDGEMQEWDNIFQPVWDFVNIEDRGTVLVLDPPEGEEARSGRPVDYDNIVWHFDLLREPGDQLMWIAMHDLGYGTYFAHFYNAKRVILQHMNPEGGYDLGQRALPAPDGETWNKFSMAYFNGELQLWLDDELYIGSIDDDPVESGPLYLDFMSSSAKVYFDNLVVCGLEEPHAPLVDEADS